MPSFFTLDLKKLLNLNSYEWWRNHRKFVTIGIFLALSAGYIRTPLANDFKVRDVCGRLESGYQISGVEAIKKLKLKSVHHISDIAVANDYCLRYLGIM